MIIFTHFPKTAGTSTTCVIRHNYYNRRRQHKKKARTNVRKMCRNIKRKKLTVKNFLNKKFKIKSNIGCIRLGPFGIHEIFNIKDYSYFTFLRNPITRCISVFYHCLWTPNRKSNVVEMYSKTNNVLETLKFCYSKGGTLSNAMTLELVGLKCMENLIMDKQDKACGAFFSVRHSCKRKYTTNEMENFLVSAKNNLKNHYDFIGFQETWDQDIRKLCDFYGWKFKKPKERYQRKTYVTKDFDVDPDVWENEEVKELLIEMNKYDIELYQFAKQLEIGRKKNEQQIIGEVKE